MKGAVAAILGWKVIRATNHMVEDGRAILAIQGLLGATQGFWAKRLAESRCAKCDESATRRRRRERQQAREKGTKCTD
jgi:hypothetical protein